MANWFGLQIAVAGSEMKRLNLKRRGSRGANLRRGGMSREDEALAVTRDKLAGVNWLSGRVQCSAVQLAGSPSEFHNYVRETGSLSVRVVNGESARKTDTRTALHCLHRGAWMTHLLVDEIAVNL
jgi:hypothetical protein